MKRILLLEDDIINKIAAGEVVERPASVLKELLENAIDAGATQITVELEEGGCRKISVADNGGGIDPEDLPLALTRHATSKLRNTEDLFQISSLGFRGEALASIAAVSRLTLSSRTAQNPEGRRISLTPEGGLQQLSVAIPVGTTVTVADLFHQVPARAKFLKAASTEFAHCLELVQALALANPRVSLTLSHNGKERLSVGQGDISPQSLMDGDLEVFARLKQRASSVLQDEQVGELVPFFGDSPYGKVYGLASPPGLTKATSKHVITFVNGRWVKDKTVRFGITRGYHSHLPKGANPQVILYLDCDPSLIDANVHPAKTELRFQYSGEVQALISQAIRESLRSGTWIQTSTFSEPQNQTSTFSSPIQLQTFPKQDLPLQPFVSEPYMAKPSPQGFRQTPSKSLGTFASPSKPSMAQPVLPPDIQETMPWHEMDFLGCFAQCYLIFSHGEEMVMLDQHAFHERVLYEQLAKDPDLLLASQPLIIPEVLEITAEEEEKLGALGSLLEYLGVRIKIVGSGFVEILAIPTLLTRKPLPQFLQDILRLNPKQFLDSASQELSHEVLATFACHGAVKAGEELTPQELQQLIQEAQTVDFFHNCPHGRRVVKKFSRREVEHWFDRP